jgi:hypothetical protein
MLAKSILEIELKHDGPVIVRLCAHDDEDTTYLLVEFYTRRGGRCSPYSSFDHLANQTLDNQCLIPTIRHAKHLPLQLNIRKLTAFAKKYMDDCAKRHPICSSNMLKVQPTRIIDVGLNATLQNIFLTTLEDDRAQYVTLSHCCKFIRIPKVTVCSNTP